MTRGQGALKHSRDKRGKNLTKWNKKFYIPSKPAWQWCNDLHAWWQYTRLTSTCGLWQHTGCINVVYDSTLDWPIFMYKCGLWQHIGQHLAIQMTVNYYEQCVLHITEVTTSSLQDVVTSFTFKIYTGPTIICNS